VSTLLVWILLATLLALSAAFSASETALFALTTLERGRMGSAVKRLLGQPRSLLVGILFCNLVINLSFFAFAQRLVPHDSELGGIAWSLGALAVLVLFGETLPKSLALRARQPMAKFFALPLSAVLPFFKPIQRVTDALCEAIYRVLGEAARRERGITSQSLALALEHSAVAGRLLGSEAQFLVGVLELEQTRVREIMTPRVDMVMLDVENEDRDEVIERALVSKDPWVVVVEGSPDRVVGRVRTKDLLIDRERPLAEVIQPVFFVPEVASAAALLSEFRAHEKAQAVVVDEWGGTAGLVTIEDVLEEVVGELLVEGEAPVDAVVPLEGGGFRVAGSLSIRDWNDIFGRRVVPNEFETVGGFVTALLRRIPRVGDSVRSGPLVFVVHEVRARRIHSVDMHVEDALEAARPQQEALP